MEPHRKESLSSSQTPILIGITIICHLQATHTQTHKQTQHTHTHTAVHTYEKLDISEINYTILMHIN